ncbi:MAG: hypothetical protein NTY37_06060 [Methanothrix sp.]|nr:hypothetical protein [Methanothrix sp.]
MDISAMKTPCGFCGLHPTPFRITGCIDLPPPKCHALPKLLSKNAIEPFSHARRHLRRVQGGRAEGLEDGGAGEAAPVIANLALRAGAASRSHPFVPGSQSGAAWTDAATAHGSSLFPVTNLRLLCFSSC